MSIIYSPNDFSPCYRPLQAKVTETAPNTSPLVSLKVTLSNSSFIEIGSFFVEPTTIANNPTNPTTHKDYTFVFDTSRIIQDYYNFTALPDVFAAKTETNAIKVLTGWLEDIQTGTVAFELDADGLIVSGGLFGLNSFALKSLNATVQHTEDFTLSDYIFLDGTDTVSKLATKKPSNIFNICSNQSQFLGFLYNGATSSDDVYVGIYNRAGVLQKIGILLGTATGDAGYSLDAGIESMQNKTFVPASVFDDVPALAGEPTFLEDIKYAKFFYGKATINGSTYDFEANTPAACVYYDSCCNDRVFRLHWINELGFIDSYNFDSVNTKELKTKSKAGKTGLVYDSSAGTPHNVNIGGSYKYQSTAQISHKLKSKHLSNKDLDWIKYLLATPYVWAEIDSKFIPVRIADNTNTIAVEKGRTVLEIEAILSNDLIIHRK